MVASRKSMSVSSLSPQLARYPMNPPAKLAPAPVGSQSPLPVDPGRGSGVSLDPVVHRVQRDQLRTADLPQDVQLESGSDVAEKDVGGGPGLLRKGGRGNPEEAERGGRGM